MGMVETSVFDRRAIASEIQKLKVEEFEHGIW